MLSQDDLELAVKVCGKSANVSYHDENKTVSILSCLVEMCHTELVYLNLLKDKTKVVMYLCIVWPETVYASES